MSAWSQPSPSDWDRWEERLAAGEEPMKAAEAVGQTCTRFKRSDPNRHAEALVGSREARGYLADRVVEDDVIEQHPETGAPLAFKADVSDAQKQFWARRWQPAYAVGARVEVSGPDGGPVEVEDRSASLADVARVLEAVGALAELGGGAARDALPAAP